MKINTKGLVLLILVTIGLNSSCDIESVNPDENPVVNVEDDFKIDMKEALRENKEDRIFTLLLESVASYECTNYEIIYSVSFGGNNTNVSINEIEEPADCIPGEGAAVAEVALAHLGAGTQGLNIKLLNSIENSGQVTISEEKITLEMPSDDGISLQHSEMYRVPEDIIWGYFSYDDSVQEFAEKMQTQLQDIVTEEILEKGYYGQFSIMDNNEIAMDMNPEYPNVIKFFYHYSDEDSILQEWGMANFSTTGFEAKVFTSAGKVYE